MKIETIQAIPAIANRILCSLGLAGLLAYSMCHFGAIEQFLSNRVGLVHQVEVLGAKLTFDAGSIQRLTLGELPPAASRQAAEDVNKLDQHTLVRLLYVGDLRNLCLFGNAKADLIENVATDYRLRDLGLVTLEESEALRDKVSKEAIDPALGVPVKCYEMALNTRGREAKTAIAFMVGAAFSKGAPVASESGKSEPAPARSASAAAGVKVASGLK